VFIDYLVFLFNIKKTASWLDCLTNRILRPYRIVLPHYIVLNYMLKHDGEPISVKDIAAQLPEQSPNVSRLVDKLENDKWVARHLNEHDKRSVIIQLTPEGKQKALECVKHFEEKISLHMKDLDNEQIKELNEILNPLPFK
jgi:DNA-binding MarR family transcriptional regulator